MKKLLFVIATAFFVSTLFAQTVTLTFTAKDAANHYVQLNRVIITNLTKSWQETIYWPDTVLTMQNGTGIDDHTLDGGFALSQNNPNPFSGTTEVSLTTVDEGKVDLDIKDMNGRIIETQNLVSLQPGNHQFRISLSTAGTYVMTARQNGKTSSIKMICNGGGGSNTLDYLGMVQTITVVLKSSTNKPFNFGDQMEYVGYAFINNTEAESQRITQVQGSSQSFTLQFAETQIYYMPTVTTNTVSGITSNTATCSGNVTSDGGAAVTERGVCWSLSHNPTISGDHTTNGSGTGAFTSSLTGLYAGRTYYVRAYARNSVGTSYGNEVSFTTSATLPEVTTGTVSNLTGTSAYCGNNYVNSVVAAPVTARGVCWSTSQNPTLNDSHTSDGSGTGSFGSSITGLAANTVYYVRAYATNSVGTAYGNVVSFTTLSPELPTVTTDNITDITLQTASVIGNVTNNGGTSLITRGVCWNTSQNPTIVDTHLTNSGDTGSFTCNLSNLIANTRYYVRAYATNSVGTAYGNELTFVTNMDGQPCPNNATVTDYDGNVYNTVQIGDQCWTKENIRTTHYANGNSIPLGNSTSNTMPYRYYPDNDANNVSTYGYLYNWYAAVGGVTSLDYGITGVQGICPDGWHVPNRSEWYRLLEYVRSQSQYECGNHNTSVYNVAKSLASTVGWSSTTGTCLPGDNPANNNATGFSALPAGAGGFYSGFSNSAFFWGASQGNVYSSTSASCLKLDNTSANASMGYEGPALWFSVRCIYGSITVNTSPTSDVTGCTVTCGGNVTADGISVGSRGVCWSKSPHPSRYDYANSDYVEDSNGTDTFTITVTGLTPGTTYYMRAFAMEGTQYNTTGVTYGEEISFTTNSMDAQSCPSATTVTDYDGNVYNTVQIGQQCWMKENVRSTHYANGLVITLGTNYYPFNGNNDAPVSTYGYRYDWQTVMKYATSSNSNPSGVQGICPSGWHVPSHAEWTQLINYVSSDNQYTCVAKALASKTGWESWTSSTNCAVGNNPITNNATGFSALPAGPSGGNARFWSTSEGSYGSPTAWTFGIEYSYTSPSIYNYSQTNKYSVRCLRDECGCNLTLPNVTTNAVNTITYTTVSYSGDVTSSGGTTVSSRGVCWSTSQNPTIANNHTTDGSGAGVFNGILTGLTSGTTYYIRAYAINSVGTTYGNEIVFTTLDQASEGQPCPNVPMVTDYDGNTYNTVKIGDQCWMKENLRTKHYANGVSIPTTGSTQSYTAPYYYACYFYNPNIPYTQCGYLYNWVAVMNGAVSSNANPSGVQGICPTGWHVPSDAEWTQLENYVGLLHPCNGNSSNIAKSLSSTNGWDNSYSNCTPGNSSSTNDATGFSGIPAGLYFNGWQDYDGESAYFWSSTEYNSTYSFYRRLKYNSESIYRDDIANNDGLSVRCIHD